MKLKLLAGIIVAVCVIAAGVGGYEKYYSALISHAVAKNVPSPTAAASNQPSMAAALPDFTGIVAQNGRAVVNISVTSKIEGEVNQSATPKLDPNDPFYWFFRRFRIPIPQGEIPMQGEGSGFIVDTSGIILTNAHVVDGASKVIVKLTDKREFKAKLIGIDKPSDVAVLKIDATNLPIVRIDSSDDVKVGEWVVAIGSPYGFENSVTAGIVSGKSRTLGAESYVPFIQMDVAVNPGNSGGPLFNAKGEVVGINSQIYTRSGGYQGLSFAIPIDVVLQVKDQLLQHGIVTRGRLGVTIQDVNQALADSFGLKQPAGALVSSVENNSAAARAGVEPGDVILRYNGKDITSSTQLPVLVANTAPGTIATLEVMRNGETRQIDVTVGAIKNDKLASTGGAGHDRGRLGVVVRSLISAERKLSDASSGVIVESVSGPAAEAGIQPGDIILSLNGTPVRSPAQLRELLTTTGKHVALLVQRDESKLFVPVDLG